MSRASGSLSDPTPKSHAAASSRLFTTRHIGEASDLSTGSSETGKDLATQKTSLARGRGENHRPASKAASRTGYDPDVVKADPKA